MAGPISITQDFRHEVEATTLKLLRRRFLWFLGTVGGIYGLSLIVLLAGLGAVAFGVGRDVAAQQILSLRGGYWGLMSVLVLTGMDVGVFVWFVREATARRNNREKLLRLTQQFLIYRVAVDLLAAWIWKVEGFPWTLAMYHTLACVLLPWTPLQALIPLLILIPLNAAVLLVSQARGITGDLVITLLSLLAGGPGLAIAALKTSRRSNELRMRFLQDRYGQMRRELVDARRIHEALFPKPFTNPHIRFGYRYQPMRQIGGDYLYARFGPTDGDREPVFDVLLIDVTGHGIAAALTVNRVYGEVERLFAEDPAANPADLLSALNRYVQLTLSRHSIFATALCMRVDVENNVIEYASGGHPPAFICRADGGVEELHSTSFVLGAVPPGDFDAGMRRVPFMPGDALVAYTDGAIEARNPDGRMLGVFGLHQAIAACRGTRPGGGAADELASALLTFVEQHRSGPPEDDTLLVEIVRNVPRPSPGNRNVAAKGIDVSPEPQTIRA
jgi:serine phosphatase RsbU (regulator of sigma subunit)